MIVSKFVEYLRQRDAVAGGEGKYCPMAAVSVNIYIACIVAVKARLAKLAVL